MSTEERNWAMFCHLASFAAFIGVPFGHILGPLIVWLIKKDSSPFVDEQGRESLNFQISLTLYSIVGSVLALVIGIVTLGIGVFLIIPIVAVVTLVLLVMTIVAALEVQKGVHYRYPFTLRFL
ncbi:DUF4870 domain-containing protein [Sulfidibacter corallicola]|uniref:DUF4870 domain-containing protein n=1 Tax=Sulfidibacter corallicola TaxID=2818388 RepID=A0A8A4TMR6_SULCO|nr:DUF4870 domain-containing protein [Sulfidibacter corallicola]QTD51279.1 DUF4870 domain-containing protein [Sulfidibacter corallicola]